MSYRLRPLVILLALGIVLSACGGARTATESTESETEEPPAQFAQVAVGESHACGLLTDGRVYCWGANHRGQAIPNDDEEHIVTPQHVEGIRAQAIAATAKTTCAVVDGYVACWGHDQFDTIIPSASEDGPLPDLPGIDWISPQAVAQGQLIGETQYICPETGYLSGVSALSSWGDSFCALTEDGEAFCWGRGMRFLNANASGANDGECPIRIDFGLDDAGPPIAIEPGSKYICGLFEQTSISSPYPHLACIGEGESRGFNSEVRTIVEASPEGLREMFGDSLSAPPSLDANGDKFCLTSRSGTVTCMMLRDNGETDPVFKTDDGRKIETDYPNEGTAITGEHICLLNEGQPPYCVSFDDYSMETWTFRESARQELADQGPGRDEQATEPEAASREQPSRSDERTASGDAAISFALRAVAASDLSGNRSQSIYADDAAVSCGITTSGEAVCWGDNTYGSLGIGHSEELGTDNEDDAEAPSATPADSPGWSMISAEEALPQATDSAMSPEASVANDCSQSLELGEGPVVIEIQSDGMTRTIRLPEGYFYRGLSRSEIRLAGLEFETSSGGPPRSDGWSQMGISMRRDSPAGSTYPSTLMFADASTALGCFQLPSMASGTVEVTSRDDEQITGEFRSDSGDVSVRFAAEVGPRVRNSDLDAETNFRATGSAYRFDGPWSGLDLQGHEPEGRTSFAEGRVISDLGTGYLIFQGRDEYGLMSYELPDWEPATGLVQSEDGFYVDWVYVKEMDGAFEAIVGNSRLPEDFENPEYEAVFGAKGHISVPEYYTIPRLETLSVTDPSAPVRTLEELEGQPDSTLSDSVWIATDREDVVAEELQVNRALLDASVFEEPSVLERVARWSSSRPVTLRSVDVTNSHEVVFRRRNTRSYRDGANYNRSYVLDEVGFSMKTASLTFRRWVGEGRSHWETRTEPNLLEVPVSMSVAGETLEIDEGSDGDIDETFEIDKPVYPMEALPLIVSQAELAAGDRHEFHSLRYATVVRSEGEDDRGFMVNPELLPRFELLEGTLAVEEPVQRTVNGGERSLLPVVVTLHPRGDAERTRTRTYYINENSGAVELWEDGNREWMRVPVDVSTGE
jgi:hypothetical protein